MSIEISHIKQFISFINTIGFKIEQSVATGMLNRCDCTIVCHILIYQSLLSSHSIMLKYTEYNLLPLLLQQW